jgi:hypothetical protein
LVKTGAELLYVSFPKNDGFVKSKISPPLPGGDEGKGDK